MNESPGALLPEVLVAASAVAGIVAGAWLPRRRQWLVGALAAAAAACGLVATAVAFARPSRVVFGTSFAVDPATNAVRAVVLAALLVTLALAAAAFRAHPREAELYVLLQLGALGALALGGADDLLLLFAAYLLASVPLYALAGFAKDDSGTEAALKYYLLGALLGVLTLAGIAILYGAGGATAYGRLAAATAHADPGVLAVGLVAVLAGLLFKAGAVPVHFWVPDVVDGATTPVAAFVTTVPKVGALVATYRLLTTAFPDAPVRWPLLLGIVAAASMTLGNLAAFFQTRVRRLLAYSTVSQVGYLLIATAARSGLSQKGLLFYLAAYAAANLGAFAVVAALPGADTLDDYRGLARRHPGLAASLVVCLLALVGTPPTAVFFGKLELFGAAVDGGATWLAAVAVANTVASLFYYLRWLAPAFLGDADAGSARKAVRPASVTAYAVSAVALALGPLAGLALPLLTGALYR